jgi:hypothetical protein
MTWDDVQQSCRPHTTAAPVENHHGRRAAAPVEDRGDGTGGGLGTTRSGVAPATPVEDRCSLRVSFNKLVSSNGHSIDRYTLISPQWTHLANNYFNYFIKYLPNLINQSAILQAKESVLTEQLTKKIYCGE